LAEADITHHVGIESGDPVVSRTFRAEALVLGVFIVLSLVLVEVGYRVYLSLRLVTEVSASVKPESGAPTFSFWAYPAAWRFDKDLGFVFNDGPWLAGNIVEGKFNGCGVSGSGNRYGNAYAVHSDYEHAALKVLMLGSSYTMVPNPEGWTVADVLGRRLSERLGKSVSVLNFARDATGVLSYFDIARAKATELKPDLMLFAVSSTGLGYQRHWRVVYRDPQFSGIWRMAFSLDPTDNLSNRRRVVVQSQVISDEVNPTWCDRMGNAMKSGDVTALRGDPLVVKLM